MRIKYFARHTCIGLLSLFVMKSKGQNYAVNLIPDSLKEGAHSVTRNYQMSMIIKDPTHIIVQSKIAVTVLDEEGTSDANFQSYYSKLYSIEDIDGVLYDAQGNKLKTVKKKDIEDHALDGDGSLMADDRYKEHSFHYTNYPYTTEYTYSLEYRTLFLTPSWYPNSYDNALQSAQLTIKIPANMQLRLLGIGLPKLPEWQQQGNDKVFQYAIHDLKAQSKEPLSPISIENNFPKILIGPTNVIFDNYSGNMSTWKDMGTFIYSLYQGRDQLPNNVKKDVHNLADPLSSTRDKVAALYKYLQNTTRYVSIQLGIGGWQPFPASEVASKKYGDCKALSNYMFSLLKEAGISSNPIIINAGNDRSDYIPNDFPGNYFNHVILCVPQTKDTIWLECTSQTNPFGYMSAFTANRNALLIGPQGGTLIATPNYSPIENLQRRTTIAEIDAQGNMKAQMTTFYRGEQQDYVSRLLHHASEEDRKKYVNTMFSLPTYEVTKSTYKEGMEKLPTIEEALTIDAPKFATTMGKRIMFGPNAFNYSSTKLDASKKRVADIAFSFPFYDTDSVIYKLPEGYEIESQPKDQSINSFFGKYTIRYQYGEGQLVCIRTQERIAGRYPSKDYAEIAQYFEAIYKADRAKVVLKRKEP